MNAQNALQQVAICRIYALLQGEITTVGGSTNLSSATDLKTLNKFGVSTGTLRELGYIPREGLSFESKAVDEIKTFRVNSSNNGYRRGATIEVASESVCTVKLDSPTEFMLSLIFASETKPVMEDSLITEAPGFYPIGIHKRRVTGAFLIEMYDQDSILRNKLFLYGEASMSGKTDFMGNKTVVPEFTIELIDSASVGQFITSPGGFED